MHIRNLPFNFCLLLALQSPPVLAEETEIAACNATEECVILAGVCPGEWVAVNQRFANQEKTRIKQLSLMVECLEAARGAQLVSTVCKDRHCTVVRGADPNAFRHPKGLLNNYFYPDKR